MRPKYPYIRGVLLDYYRAERDSGKDPVEAWKAIVEDPTRRSKYKSARGKAGWRRVTWDEATELVAAAQIYTIKKFGPDHLAAFSPIPAMSIVSFISGQRLNALQGGVMLSFYEWYHDLPHNSPMMWGDQTDVHESADWYQSTYWVVIGSNLPMTRTADAHFASEFKYNGGKLVNLAPNYSDVTKFADLWVPIKPGTDAAFLMACIHVILKEFYVERRVPYFENYVKQHTNLPFLVILNKDGDRYRAGRFLRASDVVEYSGEENAEWKPLLIDSSTGELKVPNGTIGFRWEKELTGKWNLEMKDSVTGKNIDPVLSFIEGEDQKVLVAFDDFTDTFSVDLGKTVGKGRKATEHLRGVPAKV
ncbi:MAG: molybdopterin-dependent oxidoreductase, partial [Thermoplasmata archaeon]